MSSELAHQRYYDIHLLRRGSVTVTPRPARHVIRMFLKTTGYHGICLPPFGIYILPECLTQRSILLHEQCHWDQAKRMGLLPWAFAYLWYNLRYGYYNNPLEIEARAFARGHGGGVEQHSGIDQAPRVSPRS